MQDTSEIVMERAMDKIFLWRLLKQRRSVQERLMKNHCQDMKRNCLVMRNHLNQAMKNLLHHLHLNPLMKNQ